MPPKGKSKALAAKHSYLGQFTKNAKSLDDMKIKLAEQERLKSELQNQSEELHVSLKGLKKSVNDQQRTVKLLRRRLSRKNKTVTSLVKDIQHVDVKLKRLQPVRSRFNTAFSISKRTKINRRENQPPKICHGLHKQFAGLKLFRHVLLYMVQVKILTP